MNETGTASAKRQRAVIGVLIATFLFGVMLVLLALLLEEHHWNRVWHGFALELGLGFIVGCIVAVSIEWYLRGKALDEAQEMEAKVRENVFEALFETAIPRELVTEMYRALIFPKFVREDLIIKLALRRLPEGDDHAMAESLLIAEQTYSFTALNITDKVVSHNIQPAEDVLIPHRDYDPPFVEFFMQGLGDAIHWGQEELKTKIGARPDGSIRRGFEAQQTVEVARNGRATVRVVVRKVFRYADTETWVTRYAARNLTLVVELEHGLFDELEFSVNQAHRQPLIPSSPAERDGRTILHWKLDSPILPYQGVILRWRRKKAPAIRSGPTSPK